MTPGKGVRDVRQIRRSGPPGRRPRRRRPRSRSTDLWGITAPTLDNTLDTVSTGTNSDPAGHLPITGKTKKVLQGALCQTALLRHEEIGTDHLLLALLTRSLTDLAPLNISEMHEHHFVAGLLSHLSGTNIDWALTAVRHHRNCRIAPRRTLRHPRRHQPTPTMVRLPRLRRRHVHPGRLDDPPLTDMSKDRKHNRERMRCGRRGLATNRPGPGRSATTAPPCFPRRPTACRDFGFCPRLRIPVLQPMVRKSPVRVTA